MDEHTLSIHLNLLEIHVTSATKFSLTISVPTQAVIIGTSMDYGICIATAANGNKCKAIINKYVERRESPYF